MCDELNKFRGLHEFFYHISEIHKDTVALSYYENDEKVTLYTYEELRKQCEEIKAIFARNRLLNISTSIIGIYCNPGPAALVCMLGILVNNSFIYLSSNLRETELSNLIMQVPVSTLIMDKDFYPKFSSSLKDFVIAGEFHIFNQGFLLINLSTQSSSKNEILWKYSLAYVVCTSGSTGSPKLIYVPHKCIVPNIEDFKELFNVSSCDTILNVSPLSFDPSIVDIFLSLSYGAHLIMLAPNLVKKSKLLEAILQNNRISVMQVTPSLMGTLSPAFLRQYFSSPKSPRIIAFGGEVFPSPLQCKEWFSPHCKIRIFNLYGLTELSCWASCHEVNIPDYLLNSDTNKFLSVPLGIPLTGTTLYLADDLGSKVNQGTGNIVIGGERNVCVIFKGKKFAKDIITGDIGYTDGTHIFYVDRSFNSIKRNGCKVGLTEIEVALKLLSGITQCCAIFCEKIYLFVTLAQSVSLNEKSLWIHLENYLSAWKMPNQICILEKLPINQNGKIDKQELIEKVRCTSNYISHTIKSQIDETVFETMSRLWREHLEGCFPKGNDNFVNLGGDSIKAVQLAENIGHFYVVDNPLILQTLLNDTFEDICNLVEIRQSLTLPQVNSNFRKVNLKRKCDPPESSSKVSATLKPCTSFIDRGGYRNHNGHKVVSVFRNIKSMKTEWKVSLNKCIDASPLLIESDERIRVFIGSHSHKLACIDENGLEIWTNDLPDRIESSVSMSLDGQAIYVGCYDGNLYCLDVSNGLILWKVSTNGIIKSSPTVDSRMTCVIFGSYDKHLYCCNSKGEIQWKGKISNGSIFSSPAITDNYIYVATLDGYIVCLDLDGNVKWKKLIGKPIFSSVAVFSCGIVFGCTDNFLYCLNYDSEILWKYKTGGPIFSSPFILENESEALIAIGSHDCHVYLFDQCGVLVTCVKLSSPIFSSPFMVMDEEKPICYTFVCETKGEIHIFETQLSSNTSKSSNLVVKCKLDGEIFSSPVFHKGKLYVGCRDNYLYCLAVTNAKSKK